MKYAKVALQSIGYELPPVVVTTSELEERLLPLLERLHVPEGHIQELTGIVERRWWPPGPALSRGALAAARKALENSHVRPSDIDTVIYGGVCRESFEPATACPVAASLGVSPDALIYDISNACLGVINGIMDVANRIELGQSKAGLVISAESAREINEIAIQKMLDVGTMDYFIGSLATLTGGSGAVAVLLSDASMADSGQPRLMGGASCCAPEHHRLCRWGVDQDEDRRYTMSMHTDSSSVLRYGVELGERTWRTFLAELGWQASDVNRTICHQVGSSHQETILKRLGLSPSNDFITYPFLGNIGTVSLPVTAAIAMEREFLKKGDKVAFLGIGSGLNCLMLGWQW